MWHVDRFSAKRQLPKCPAASKPFRDGALFTEDGVFVTDTGPVNGRPAIEKYHADLFTQFHLSNSLITVDEDSPHIIGTAGNELWATGAWSATIQGQNFGPIQTKAYWSVIREGDDWNIRMLTSVPAATPSPTTTPSNQ
jgi:ketosteroid isomerase-like protein